jgi:hypothetical protein
MKNEENKYLVGFEFKVNLDYFTEEVQVRSFSGYSFIFDGDSVYILSDTLFKISDSDILKTTIKPYSLTEIIEEEYFSDFDLTGSGNLFSIVEYGSNKYIFKDGEDASEFLNIIQLIDAGKLLRREAFKILN